MLEYQKSVTSEEFVDENPQLEAKHSLTKLWEIIVRTNRLPEGTNEAFLYQAVREKLIDPEREVRQHALRVLMDLIPVTQPSNLNTRMNDVLPEVLSILDHPSPSLSKSALDTLKKYLKVSKNYNNLMKELSKSSMKFTTLVPFLISSETDDGTVKMVVEQIWRDITNTNVNQEIAAKALARIRYNLGDERFKHIIGLEKYHQLQNICENYGLPINYSDEDIGESLLWSDEELIEDKVILETEITLRTGPAITMKIHEESRPTSANADSIENNSNIGVIKILDDDSESDYEARATRTPRKVRFGGESVKLRTPESDSSNQDDSKDTLRITVTDAISITTRKSLIPIRITSLPSTPLRSSKSFTKKRLHQSAPNLSRNFGMTKLPLRRDSNLVEKFKINEVNAKVKAKPHIKKKSKSSDLLLASSVHPSRPPSRMIQRSEAVSPILVHNEIELFHNLTRSPVRQRRLSSVDTFSVQEDNKSVDHNVNNGFNSFKLYTPSIESVGAGETDDVYDSFKVCPFTEENKVNTAPPPKDIRVTTETSRVTPETLNKVNSAPPPEDIRVTTATSRVTSETSNKVNTAPPPKDIRVTTATSRVTSETSNKVTTAPPPEDVRVTTEISRVTTETSNKVNTAPSPEDIRVTIETSRVTTETSRVTTETSRVTTETSNNYDVDQDSMFSSFERATKDPDEQLCSDSMNGRQQIKPLEYKPTDQKNDFDSFKLYSSASDAGYANTETSQDEHFTNDELKTNGGLELFRQWQISSFSSDDNLWSKSESLDNLVKMLKQPNTCECLEPGPAALLFEALFACQHLDKLHFLADDALVLMMKHVRPEVLEQCLGRLTIGICKIGAPSGISLALLVMKKCLPRKVLTEVMDRCFAHKTREGALQVLMASARLLPRNDLEVMKMTEFAAATLRDRRRRVRHAALETLATLAQLTSNSEVLDVVERVTKAAPDHQHLLRVVRTRLSRRQLPTVEVDGTIRYSTPRDQTELEWLSGRSTDTQSASSSGSSSNNSVNYWRHNSRHEEDDVRVESALSSNRDDSAIGNQQIWALDPTVFPRNGHVKENSGKANPPILRPVYILQPEAVTDGGKGHRRYDRGRSFSPPKTNQKQPLAYVAASTTPHHLVATPRQFKYKEGVRKSFSSEQLYIKEGEQHEPYSFSMSSRSSTTSTGSSTKSGTWHKEMRSGIPVPISAETKFRLRTNSTASNSASGPVIARRSALGNIQNVPVITRLSPRETSDKNLINVLPPPPQSSGSESSGYFTPPPETKKAFVKLDSIDRTSESEEKDVENDTNNNVEESNDEVDNAREYEKRNLSASSVETVEPNEQSIPEHFNSSPLKTEVIEKEENNLRRFSISRSKESLFTEKPVPVLETRNKSKSVVDLQSFLPEISPSRKITNSAPMLKDDLVSNGNLVLSTYEEIKTVIPLTQEDVNVNPESPVKEITITRKLTRRLSRTQSKRSIKSTPREQTPSSSRVNSKSKDSLQIALNQLNNPEWEVMIQGLQTLTRVAKYYPEVIEGQMHTVCINLAKHIKNLRSQVARAACHTATELFGSCRRGLEVELEELVGPLLHRTADTNKFLRADANAALDVMCENLPMSRVVTVISARGCTHQNSIVRSASIRLIADLVKRQGADKIFTMNKDVRDKIMLAGANALSDGSLDARNHGKELFSYLVGHPQFQKTLLEVVPQNTLRNIAKTLNSVKPFVET